MCYYICLEDLVANALIEKAGRGQEPFVSYRDIEKYGTRVVRILKGNGKKAALNFSRQQTDAFLKKYSNYFSETEKGQILGIALNRGIGSEILISEFRGFLPLELLLALMSKSSLRELGISDHTSSDGI